MRSLCFACYPGLLGSRSTAYSRAEGSRRLEAVQHIHNHIYTQYCGHCNSRPHQLRSLPFLNRIRLFLAISGMAELTSFDQQYLWGLVSIDELLANLIT